MICIKYKLFLIIILTLCEFQYVFALGKFFESSSILYGIATIAEDQTRHNASKSQCYKQLTELYNAVEVGKVWAYKMIDVSGRPNQGFLSGSNGWTGLSITCADLTNRHPLEVYHAKVVQLITNYDYPPYELSFITAFLTHNSSLQLQTNLRNQNLISLGLCVPLSCKSNDIKSLLEIFLKKNILTFQKLYDIDFEIVKMKTVESTSSWLTHSPQNLITLVLITGSIMFVLCATYYHTNIFQNKLFTMKENNKLNVIEQKNDTNSLEEINKATSLEKIILSFSWSNTYKFVLKSDVPEQISAANGLMFFAILGISIYHFLIYGALYTKNLPLDFRKYEGFMWQIVASSSFSIDSYLFLSGCLVTYNFYIINRDTLLNATILTKIYEIIKLIGIKLIRCLPVYIMWIIFGIFLSSYLEARWPSLLPERPHDACSRSWWRNILFINNFQPLHSVDTCMSWTWLMAADMQYYLFNILILLLSTFSFKLSISCTCVAIFYCIYSTGFTAYNSGYIHTLDQQIEQASEIYYLPWYRVGPYAIGMLTAHLLYIFNGKLPLTKKFILLGWSLAPVINLYLIFGLYGITPSIEFSSSFIAIGRILWAISLAWILITCSTDNAGFINSILSYGVFKIFHRLSYSTYILTVLNIIFICVTYETTIYLSTTSYICQIFSFTLCSYLLNIIITMFYDVPFQLLWETFIKGK